MYASFRIVRWSIETSLIKMKRETTIYEIALRALIVFFIYRITCYWDRLKQFSGRNTTKSFPVPPS